MNFKVSKKGLLLSLVALALSAPASCPAMEATPQTALQTVQQIAREVINNPAAQAIAATAISEVAVPLAIGVGTVVVVTKFADGVADVIERINQPLPDLAENLAGGWDNQSKRIDNSQLASVHKQGIDLFAEASENPVANGNQQITPSPAPEKTRGCFSPPKIDNDPGCSIHIIPEMHQPLIHPITKPASQTTITPIHVIRPDIVLRNDALSGTNVQDTEQQKENPEGSQSHADGNKAPKSLEDIFGEGRYTKSRTGTKIYVRPISFDGVVEEVKKLDIPIIIDEPDLKVWQMPDGRRVNVRAESRDGRATMEVFDPVKERSEGKLRCNPPESTQPQQEATTSQGGAQSQAPSNSNSTNLAAAILGSGKDLANLRSMESDLDFLGNPAINPIINSNLSPKPNAFVLGQDFPMRNTSYFNGDTKQAQTKNSSGSGRIAGRTRSKNAAKVVNAQQSDAFEGMLERTDALRTADTRPLFIETPSDYDNRDNSTKVSPNQSAQPTSNADVITNPTFTNYTETTEYRPNPEALDALRNAPKLRPNNQQTLHAFRESTRKMAIPTPAGGSMTEQEYYELRINDPALWNAHDFDRALRSGQKIPLGEHVEQIEKINNYIKNKPLFKSKNTAQAMVRRIDLYQYNGFQEYIKNGPFKEEYEKFAPELLKLIEKDKTLGKLLYNGIPAIGKYYNERVLPGFGLIGHPNDRKAFRDLLRDDVKEFESAKKIDPARAAFQAMDRHIKRRKLFGLDDSPQACAESFRQLYGNKDLSDAHSPSDDDAPQGEIIYFSNQQLPLTKNEEIVPMALDEEFEERIDTLRSAANNPTFAEIMGAQAVQNRLEQPVHKVYQKKAKKQKAKPNQKVDSKKDAKAPAPSKKPAAINLQTPAIKSIPKPVVIPEICQEKVHSKATPFNLKKHYEVRNTLNELHKHGKSSNDLMDSLLLTQQKQFQAFQKQDKIIRGIETAAYLYENREEVQQIAEMGWEVVKYPFKAGWNTLSNTGESFSYFFNGPAESDIQDVSLSYNDDYATYINEGPNAVSEYESSNSWKLVRQAKANITLESGLPNQIHKESSHKANNVMALLQLPPAHAQEIQADAAQYQRNRAANVRRYNGMPTTEQFLNETCLENAHALHQSNPRRIRLAHAAKQAFDNKNFAAAKNNLEQALTIYNNEKLSWKLWLASRICLAEPNQRVNQAYDIVNGGIIREHYNPDSRVIFPVEEPLATLFNWTSWINNGINPEKFRHCLGSPFNQIIHEELLEKVIAAETLFSDMVTHRFQVNQNLLIKNTMPLICRIIDNARRKNQANNIPLARSIATFGDALRAAEQAAANIYYDNDSQTIATIATGFQKLWNWNSNFDYDAHFMQRLDFTLRQASDEQKNTLRNNINTAKERLKTTIKTSGGNDQNALNRRIIASAPIIELLNNNPQQGQRQATTFLSNLLFGARIPENQLNAIIAREHALTNNIVQADKRIMRVLSTIFQDALRELYQEAVQQQNVTRERREAKNLQQEKQKLQELAKKLKQKKAAAQSQKAEQPKPNVLTRSQKRALQKPAADGPQKKRPKITHDEEKESSFDDEIQAAIATNFEELAPPLQLFYELFDPQHHMGNLEALRILIADCDRAYAGYQFEQDILDGVIKQLPCTCQSYPALEPFQDYGPDHNRQCGYYAVHNAEIFATNSDASPEALTLLLNNRNSFENDTLRECKRIIQRKRGRNANTKDLEGAEIDQLLLSETILDKVIVFGAVQDTGNEAADGEVNEIAFAETYRKIHAFQNGEIDNLVWIIPANHDDHWVATLVRKDEDGNIEMFVADSLGQDRSIDPEVSGHLLHIFQTLSAQPEVAPIQQPAHRPNENPGPRVQTRSQKRAANAQLKGQPAKKARTEIAEKSHKRLRQESGTSAVLTPAKRTRLQTTKKNNASRSQGKSAAQTGGAKDPESDSEGSSDSEDESDANKASFTRRAAFKNAKRDAKVENSQQPQKIERIPMRSAEHEGGHVQQDSSGKVVNTREYHYTNRDGQRVIIQDHSAGHSKGGQGPHFNVRPANAPRTGKVSGTKDHYPFQK